MSISCHEQPFIIHYIINGRHIINLDRHHAILSNEISIPVSRTCYENVKKTFAGCVWSEEFYTT